MKSLKLTHEQAVQQRQKQRGSTWRLFDDKDITVNDVLELIDKREASSETWRPFARVRVDQIVEKRLADVADKELADGAFASREDLYARMRSYYGEAVTWKTPVKIISYSFMDDTPQGEPVSGEATNVREVKLFTDGGSRGNPGPSAAGYVLYDMEDTVLLQQGVYLGVTTNNQAEYLALKLGLAAALERSVRIVHVYMDSLLVVNQMNRRFKIKNRDLWPINDAISELLPRFEKVSFSHIPRALNKAADAMVNEALDAHAESAL